MKKITLHDKTFIKYIDKTDIQNAIHRIANQIEKEYANDVPIFIVILNGAIFFAADLMQKLNIPLEVCSVKYSSYFGTQSSGAIEQLIGITHDISNRRVIIVEDTIDTGLTIKYIYEQLQEKKVKDIKIAALALKKEIYKGDIPIDYVGFEMENQFIVGYGLDYNGLGRNLSCIYRLEEI
jgi:hypoxanthine phosphoribosyltransferase